MVLLSSDWWLQDGAPILGYQGEETTPVALLPTGSGKYDLLKPDGDRSRIDAKVAATLHSEAWVFYRPFPDEALRLMDLIRLGLRGSQRDGSRIVMMVIVTSVLALLPPIATSAVFGRLIPDSQEGQLLELGGVLVLTAIAIALFQIVRSITITRIEARIDASVQPAVWDRLLRLPAGFFRSYSAGDLAMRANGIDKARQLLTGTVLSSIIGGVTAITSALLLFYYDARLASIAVLFTLVALAVAIVATWRQLQFQRRMTALQTSISGMVLQFLTGIPKLRVAGAEDRAYAAWASRFSQQKKEELKAQSTANAFGVFNTTWPILGVVAIFAFVSTEGNASISTANLLGFLVAFTQFMTATLLIATMVTSVLQCVPLYEQARPILRAVPEVDIAKADPGRLNGDIELSHVSFRYTEDGPYAVNDISLQIKAGEFVALVGPSGAGKSSVFRLLLGFDIPESGAIYFDGKDLAHLDAEAVRRQLGVVTQDSRVMPGTIQANIIGSSLLTVQDAWEAARLAGLDNDIREMPMGMQTIISEGGGTFSGGQLQRLMIARAIVRKPRILLFDEATSALDNRTQAIVSQSLERLQATRIVIAHRLSTIEHADRIFVFQAGRIVQAGSYHDLINEPGAFADLARRQIA
jgi:ATP-binding cassette subfamily C protein